MSTRYFSRFLLVGASNALLHFIVLNIAFSSVGFSKMGSSIIATVFAMAYSFLLNKQFVFRSSSSVRSEVLAFVLVTGSGVLIIHNLIFSWLVVLLEHFDRLVHALISITGNRLGKDTILINVSTIFAAGVALAWNFIGYKFFVFKAREAVNDSDEED